MHYFPELMQDLSVCSFIADETLQCIDCNNSETTNVIFLTVEKVSIAIYVLVKLGVFFPVSLKAHWAPFQDLQWVKIETQHRITEW